MNNSSRNRKRRPGRKRQVLLTASLVVLLMGLTVGATLAWLNDKSNSVTNTFIPGDVEIEIQEPDWDGNTKKDVNIKNTGNIPANVRAKLVFTWQNDVDNSIYPAMPLECDCNAGCTVVAHGYKITMNTGTDSPWNGPSGDGWYTTKNAVPVGDSVTLVTSCVPVNPIAGYHLVMDVIAEAIQDGGGATFTQGGNAK